MNDLQRIGDIASDLEAARAAAPSEVAVAPDGSAGIIQWEGTPVTRQWLTSWVHKLMAAKLAEPYTDASAPESRATNAARLDAWHRALAGLPMEGLEAARVHFERHGVPDGRWGYLRPADVSKWVRARARRRIPAEKACEAHPDEWAHACTLCDYEGPSERAGEWLAQIRAELKRRRAQD